MFTKIYFSIVLFVLILSTYYEYLVIGSLSNHLTLFQFLAQIGLILGLFSYAFKKKFLEPKFWKGIFVLVLIHLAIGAANTLIKGSIYSVVGIQELLIGMFGFLILDFPAYYAIFKLAKVEIKKSKKKR